MLRIMKSRPYSWSLWKVPLSCIPLPPPVLCSKKQSCTARNTSFEYTLCEDEVETKSSYNNYNTGKQQQKYWLFLETKAILYWFVMNWLEVPLKDKKINILVQVIHWYFQPIIYIRLLSSLEQVTNLGFGKWQLSISVVPFCLVDILRPSCLFLLRLLVFLYVCLNK